MAEGEVIKTKFLYNKLQDKLFTLGTNAQIKMNVMLYHTDERINKRYHFHSEYQYIDKNGYLARSIQRNFNTFLSLENIKPVNGDYQYITIRGRDLELMRLFVLPRLETIIQNFDKIFEKRDGKLYCNDEVKPMEITLSSRENTLFLKPGLHKMYSDEIIPCIDLYLNSIHNMTSLNFSMVYEFMYFIRTFNIYSYAASMLAYFGSFPLETNLVDGSSNQVEQINENMYNYETQKPLALKDTRKKGFFSKELEDRRNGEHK